MLRLLFTCDYEIHGDGRGSPRELMVEPTCRMLEQFDAYGARLTLMCEVAEILRFRQHRDETGRDDFAYGEIESQLRKTVATGHDVQLHLHPEYLSASLHGDEWQFEPASCDLATLPYARVNEAIRAGKAFLEELLTPVAPAYRCVAFRSGRWSMQPSRHAVDALMTNGISIDTSVFKYGRRRGTVDFDYAAAPSQLVPWPVDGDDICKTQPGAGLIEFPIYAENRPIWSFVSLGRLEQIRRARTQSRSRPQSSHRPRSTGTSGISVGNLLRRRSWKADFNQCTGAQLIRALKRAESRYAENARELPFVLIGHSKLFHPRNERSLAPFLEFVASHADRFCFGTFADFDLDAFRNDVPAS